MIRDFREKMIRDFRKMIRENIFVWILTSTTHLNTYISDDPAMYLWCSPFACFMLNKIIKNCWYTLFLYKNAYILAEAVCS